MLGSLLTAAAAAQPGIHDGIVVGHEDGQEQPVSTVQVSLQGEEAPAELADGLQQRRPEARERGHALGGKRIHEVRECQRPSDHGAPNQRC